MSAGIAAANAMFAVINAQKLHKEDEETAKQNNVEQNTHAWHHDYTQRIAQAGSMISDIDKELKEETDPYMIKFLKMRKAYHVRQAESSQKQMDQMFKWQNELWLRDIERMKKIHHRQLIVDKVLNVVKKIIFAGCLLGLGVFCYFTITQNV